MKLYENKTLHTWKYGLHAESTILCALSNCPSTANVTSTKASSCSSWSNTESKLLWWLFQRKQNLCDAIASLLKSARLPLISANIRPYKYCTVYCRCLRSSALTTAIILNIFTGSFIVLLLHQKYLLGGIFIGQYKRVFYHVLFTFDLSERNRKYKYYKYIFIIQAIFYFTLFLFLNKKMKFRFIYKNNIRIIKYFVYTSKEERDRGRYAISQTEQNNSAIASSNDHVSSFVVVVIIMAQNIKKKARYIYKASQNRRSYDPGYW